MGLIRKLIFWPIILVILILAILLWSGGDKLRWFGQKTEETGKTIREKAEDLDRLKKGIEQKKETVNKTLQGVVDTAEKRGILKREPDDEKKR
jgi:Sec-independent protein translocase protein TatA